MEVTAAERTTIYTNISPLAQRVNNYIQTQHSSIAAVAKDIGYTDIIYKCMIDKIQNP